MSLSNKNQVLWSDIEAIYTTIRNTQSKHSITVDTAPSNHQSTLITPSDYTDLKSKVQALLNSSETHLKSNTFTISSTTPLAGDELTAASLSELDTIANALFSICHFTVSFNTGFRSFSSNFSNSGFRSFSSNFQSNFFSNFF